MRTVHLEKLKEGYPGMTEVIGAYLFQAGVFCLASNGHQSGVVLEVTGKWNESFLLTWTHEIDERVKRSWCNSVEAVAFGAEGIASLLMEVFLNFVVVERSFIGTGVDYFLGDKETVAFERKARVEISGIDKETSQNTVERRIREKLKQVKQSANTGLPAYVVVVEFASPKVKIVKDEITLESTT